jgi:predicted HTH transcriptional regulator
MSKEKKDQLKNTEKNQEKRTSTLPCQTTKQAIVDYLLEQEAISSTMARSRGALSLDNSCYTSQIERLIELDILHQTGIDNTLIYLDEENWEEYRDEQKKTLFMKLTLIIIPSIIFILLGLAWLFLA